MMMAAHSIRIQNNFPQLAAKQTAATPFDHFLLWFIDIEPIISAMFLFIAGFSLTLSFAKLKQPQSYRPWLVKITQRAATLYLIAMLFFLAEYGLQWPDFLISAGVLGTIALSIALSAALLCYGRGAKGLVMATVVVLGTTYVLETQRWQITGLNAGAGGHFPLIVMGFLGTLYGMAYQRFGDNGLFGGILLAAIVGLLFMVVDYPNTFVYKSHFSWYTDDPTRQLWQSLVHLFQQTPPDSYRVSGFWNHASVFPLRYSIVIMVVLVLFIKLINRSRHPAIRFLDALGSYGLTIYVYHLIVLAGVEVSGFKPQTGWQTLLVILALMLSGYWLIRNRIKVDPETS